MGLGGVARWGTGGLESQGSVPHCGASWSPRVPWPARGSGIRGLPGMVRRSLHALATANLTFMGTPFSLVGKTLASCNQIARFEPRLWLLAPTSSSTPSDTVVMAQLTGPCHPWERSGLKFQLVPAEPAVTWGVTTGK